MTTSQSITYVRIAEVLTELGMITEQTARRVLDEFVDFAAKPIEDRYEVASALESFDVAVSIHADDVDFADAHYEWLLNEAANLTGGKVTVSDYRFDKSYPDDEDCGLGTMHFACNGKPLSFGIEQESNDYLDMGAAQEAIEALDLGDDPREFRRFEQEGPDLSDDIMVLASAEQREGLLRLLGLTFEARWYQG
ncbi:hypothetical protein EJ357_01940 [Streptomyces cyaneochromogenes]|uniref:Uncharacterized protein n=1 Tax=Streptomyces cyaneochromogenes TaxID=2496836 RepID=A0A3S9LZK7_9ACTN|nr:hypothetical protein [Streptomyces cyaneochromogenes]AZQ32363.1 hypothetical protein EJ357_01940 [Streptomyces cyaneochromogenes]